MIRRPLAWSRSFLFGESGISVRSPELQTIQTRAATLLAHAEGNKAAVGKRTDPLIAGGLLLATPSVQGQYLVNISLGLGQGNDLYHVRTVIDAFLHDGLESFERVGSLEVVVRPYKDRAVFVGRLPYPLGHLLLSLDLHIDISCTRLDGS